MKDRTSHTHRESSFSRKTAQFRGRSITSEQHAIELSVSRVRCRRRTLSLPFLDSPMSYFTLPCLTLTRPTAPYRRTACSTSGEGRGGRALTGKGGRSNSHPAQGPRDDGRRSTIPGRVVVVLFGRLPLPRHQLDHFVNLPPSQPQSRKPST